MNNTLPDNCPTTSPWGHVQYAKQLADGAIFVSTSSHGGIKLDRQRNSLIPKVFRIKGGWYEEDCNWAIPVYFLICEPDKRGEALQTIKDWHWKEYEAHFDTILVRGESFTKDEYLFETDNVNNWVAISWDKQENGKILIIATKGGKRGDGHHQPERKRFWIPLDEYKARGRFGYVVDETKYQAID